MQTSGEVKKKDSAFRNSVHTERYRILASHPERSDTDRQAIDALEAHSILGRHFEIPVSLRSRRQKKAGRASLAGLAAPLILRPASPTIPLYRGGPQVQGPSCIR